VVFGYCFGNITDIGDITALFIIVMTSFVMKEQTPQTQY
jgi:hypothetical protein